MSEVLTHLRSRERAAFELWRSTTWDHPALLARGADWHRALRALSDELNARLSITVQTSGTQGAADAR